jgi:hypothetical protein
LKKSPDIQVVESAPLRYLFSLPTAPSTEGERWPVLCFLHGYDEAAPLEIRRALTRYGPLRSASWPGVVKRCIVIAPQLPKAGDIWYRYADAVRQIVAGLQRAHYGDSRRTYLTGFSFGGNGVFDLAVMQPEYWAALWTVDPTRVPNEDPRCPIWLSFGQVARYRTSGFIRALDLKPADAGAEGDRLYLDQRQDHTGSAALAYQDARIYAWLLSKRLPPRS